MGLLTLVVLLTACPQSVLVLPADSSPTDSGPADTFSPDAPPDSVSDAGADTVLLDATVSLCGTSAAECMAGDSVACVTTCRTRGHGICTETCRLPVETCEPPPEVCDGVDNDCDGVADDGLPFRIQHVAELDPPEDWQWPATRLLQTPGGLVLIYVTERGVDGEVEYSYYGLRLSDFGESVAAPQLLGSYRGPTGGVTGVSSFQAVAFRDGLTIIHRVPAQSQVVVQQWVVPLLSSEPLEMTSSMELISPQARDGLRSHVEATEEYVAIMLNGVDGVSLNIVREGEEGLQQVGERLLFSDVTWPLVAEGQLFLIARDRDHHEFRRVVMDTVADRITVESIPGSTVVDGTLLLPVAAGNGDVLVTPVQSNVDVYRLPAETFDCPGICQRRRMSRDGLDAGLYHGGRWVILSSRLGGTMTLTAYDQQSLQPIHGFAVSRSFHMLGGMLLPLANGDFGAAGLRSSAMEFVRYTCRPEEEP